MLEKDRQRLRALAQKPASEGKRVVALAYCREGGTQASYAAGAFGALVLIGFVTLEDGLRAEAPRAVADLRGAGVQVVMITGDGKQTAEKIARACGILGGGVVMNARGYGGELRQVETRVRAMNPDGEIIELFPKWCKDEHIATLKKLDKVSKKV